MRPAPDPALVEALNSSQRLGMLGSRPIPEVIEHAMAFVTALANVSGVVIDLGTGGGVPGLVIARTRPDLHLVLLDRRATRTDHVTRLVSRLDLGDRVTVLTADATVAIGMLVPADAVVARGFGGAATTLRAASALLGPQGVVVISEPPGERVWDARVVANCGLRRQPVSDRRIAVFVRDADVSRGTSDDA